LSHKEWKPLSRRGSFQRQPNKNTEKNNENVQTISLRRASDRFCFAGPRATERHGRPQN
jgi:hypothetical protein